MKSVLALGRAELLLLLRNRMALFNAAVLPVPLVGLTASAASDGDPAGNSRLVTGLLGMVILGVVYYNLVTTYVARREELVLKRLRTGELTDAAILVGTAGPTLAVAVLQILLFVAGGAVLMGLPVPVNAPVLLFGAVAGVVAFVLLAAVSSALTRTVELAQITTLPVLVVCLLGTGLFVPPDTVPPVVADILRWLPLAPATELMRLGWVGDGGTFLGVLRAAAAPAGLLVAWTVLGWLAVLRWFRWEPRR
ncbi:ABC transporter permease [Dactylosporangium fulvum]|uniref:ABC transporter permease n=1 Tax=Dactylosporangium fulvum TaxID=53359 RepID=A0ABY5W8A5_9ACTN|nr:ABC transporter permease [Dactylosporangium fulvum]UWP86318.1 ABC transporter permease [Dactylosporangium fulvum]